MIMITDPSIEAYLTGLSVEADQNILEMEKIGKETNFPIVDRLVGRLLFLLTKLKQPKLIVELGSGFGYSAYWFARALENGKVVLTDHRVANMDYARKTFQRAGFTSRAEFRTGDAIEIAREFHEIDILFIDIDKHQYVSAIRTLLPNLTKNGLVIADNALWYGRVLEKNPDRDTLGIQEFNNYMFASKDFFATIVPIRDGVLLACKLT